MRDEELIRYINLKLAALGQPVSRRTADPGFPNLAQPLLRNYLQKDELLGGRLCPVDTRIQRFLNRAIAGTGPSGAARLPANTLVLDRAGMAHVLSLPIESDHFTSPYLESFRVAQGVLHNPASDKRVTQGSFISWNTDYRSCRKPN